ncbi:hypothetical protein GUJ93_ZPchr0011g28416 [Zizania palustris]|uniref:Agglutinin domain-containing protein n=1 Tax=Zizania palustris TaxID=103762 RepID=A0A8J5WLD7_ZIZPA|nr:hypothetical protein GUJ93_ZPchr0011g28416 [Zizania palustris]
MLSEGPKCVAFRSEKTGRYLRYAHESDKPLLELSGEDCISPYTRFYVEASKEHQGLMHIRCCYNNTYWVAKEQQQDGGGWIITTVDEPEDDLSNPSCTLFNLVPAEPLPLLPAMEDDDDSPPHSVRLLHARLGKQVDLQVATGESEVGKDSKNDLNAYTLVDFRGQEKQLPRYVVFKGDNDKYLSGRVIQRYNYLQFASDDMADETVINTTHYLSNGTVRIKNIHFGRFWRRSPNWIWADSSDTGSSNRDTIFTVVKVGGIFALRNMGNNSYCKRLTTEGKTNCLNAAVKTIAIDARLKVEEPVFSRQIYDVTYNLSKARIYDKKVIAMDRSAGDNNGSTNSRIKLSFTYSETQTTSWDSTLSLMLGVETKIKAGVPLIADGSVTIKAEFTGSYTWGESIEKSVSRQTEYEADVAPHTRVTITLVAEQAHCDVPFSYKQRDIMYDGRTVIQTKHDGIYTCANSFSFRFDRKDEKIQTIDYKHASMHV